MCRSGSRGVALFLSDVTASYCICILYRIVKSLSPQSVSGFGGSHIQWLDCVGHPPPSMRKARASKYIHWIRSNLSRIRCFTPSRGNFTRNIYIYIELRIEFTRCVFISLKGLRILRRINEEKDSKLF